MPTSQRDYLLQYVKIDDAINLLKKVGEGSFLAKTDICSAFRNVPVHPLGITRHALEGRLFWEVLPFDLRSAPHFFNQLSEAYSTTFYTFLTIFP